MILILGSQGMLGSMLAKTWPEATAVDRLRFSVENPDRMLLADASWVINCIGLIKPHCVDVEQAIKVNALFPYSLPENTIQIATDCVYSGTKGAYVETDLHDATDVYGKTKSLGESPQVKNLRCSIIGPELKNHKSLLDWFLAQERANGFVNHYWNGITTLHYSKMVQGILREGIELPPVQHIVPRDVVTKAELLRIIAKAYDRDIPVTDVIAEEEIDRTLHTNNPELNARIWKAAGYDSPPTVKDMIEEMAELP